MVSKLSALDSGYSIGDLSVYPGAYDDKSDLYVVTNNAETILKQALSYNGSRIIVEDASMFPQSGLVRIGTSAGEPGTHEIIYYNSRTDTVFTDLIRGFAGTRQNRWSANIPVIGGVMADHINIIRDAIYNIQSNLGISSNPASNSLNDLLQQLEEQWLAPRPFFRAYPLSGPSPLIVRFQNFTLTHSVRFLWDFGDGTTSTEKSPIHTYLNEGNYTVRLDVVTNTSGTGIVQKYSYIQVDDSQVTPMFYVLPDASTPGNYSVETAEEEGVDPTIFNFVDQTNGDIIERHWIWGDGENTAVMNPNIHSSNHIYQSPGTYSPSLLLVFASSLSKREFLKQEIIVI